MRTPSLLLCVICAWLAFTPVRAWSEEAQPAAQLKQRLAELQAAVERRNEAIEAIKLRLQAVEERTYAIQLLAEEYALRLSVHEKGVAREFEARIQPEALARVSRPMGNAQAGDWVEYSRSVETAVGLTSGETYRITVSDKQEKSATLKIERTSGGKTEAGELLVSAPGPFDPFDMENKQRREPAERSHETLEAAGRKLMCLRVRYSIFEENGGNKTKQLGDRICWINTSVPLTGLAKVVQHQPNGDKTILTLSGYGTK